MPLTLQPDPANHAPETYRVQENGVRMEPRTGIDIADIYTTQQKTTRSANMP